MSDSQKNLHIQWKGRTTGPYSRDELDDMLKRGEISLLHRVEDNGRWQSVGEYIERNVLRIRALDEPREVFPVERKILPGQESSKEPPRHEKGGMSLDQQVFWGYILCGAAFVLPVLATIPALWLAFQTQTCGAKEPARLQFILCMAFTMLGTLFWVLFLMSTYK
ncbi:MAG: hypothetical protein LBV54_04765 [Puniceicoccales bacterium]|jgi:hypothetical protein|nr:hypothetical protein [Puniceicoccales bacterium]